MKNQHTAAVTVADEDADGSIAVPNRDRTKRRKTSGPDILQLTIDELRFLLTPKMDRKAKKATATRRICWRS
jgi:hypothetical protein